VTTVDHTAYPAHKPPRLAHQDGDVEWGLQIRKGLLANEAGLGKTRSAIDITEGLNTLVIVPAMLVNTGTWQDEIDRWSATPDKYTIAAYSQLNERDGAKILPRRRPEFRGPWEAVILDEAHYVKGRKTNWTAMAQLCADEADIVLPMTGTPIPNWAHELFTVLRLINPKEAKRGKRYGGFWRWAGEWFDCAPTRFSHGKPVAGELLGCSELCLLRPVTDPCKHYINFTEVNLGDRYRRMWRDDCLDLPPMTEQLIRTPMEARQKATYNKIKKDFAATVEGTEILAWSRGAQNVTLDRITVSEWMVHQTGEPRGGKFEQLRFDLEARSRPTFVLAHYRDVVEACARVAESTGARSAYVHGGVRGTEAEAAIRDFKAGKIDVLVGSLEKVAEGLTLTQADMAIFVEKSYKPYRNEQAKYRIYRVGQTRPVTVRDYMTPYSIDEGKRELLATKTDRQMRHLSAAEFLQYA